LGFAFSLGKTPSILYGQMPGIVLATDHIGGDAKCCFQTSMNKKRLEGQYVWQALDFKRSNHTHGTTKRS
jgi:hypothetical protein